MSRLPLLLLTSSGILEGSMKTTWEAVLQQARHATGSWKVAYVPDAALLPSKWPNRTSEGMAKQWIGRTGLSDEEVETIELATLHDGAATDALASVAAVYVESGNTYYLTYHTRRTGFDAAVASLVGRGGLYAGASAGAILAGSTLETCEWKAWDDPGAGEVWDLTKKQPGGYGLDGLGLIQGGAALFPHHAPQWEAVVLEKRRGDLESAVLLDEYHFWVQGDLPAASVGGGGDGFGVESTRDGGGGGEGGAQDQAHAPRRVTSVRSVGGGGGSPRSGRLVPSGVTPQSSLHAPHESRAQPTPPKEKSLGTAGSNETTKGNATKGVAETQEVEVNGTGNRKEELIVSRL